MARWYGLGAIAVVLLVLFTFIDGMYTVDEGERGVILRTGSVVGVAQPGFHLKYPFVDSIVTLSVRELKYEFEPQSSYSKDLQEALINISVNYAIIPSDAAVEQVYRQYGSTYFATAIMPVVPQRLKEVFGQYQATTVVSDRTKLGTQVEDAIRASIPGDLFLIKRVQITNVDFSDQYERAIEAAAQAEAEVRRARNELERQRIDAEKLVVDADARAKAVLAAAEAEAKRIQLAGDAEALAIKAKGAALRDNPELVKLIATERWNGVLPTTQVPGSAVPFIELPQTQPPR